MIATLLTTLLPALIPAGIDIVKGVTNHFIGGDLSKPTNHAEWVEVQKAQTERLRVIAELDKPAANISRWVADLRASSRYIMVFLIFIAWAVLQGLEGGGVIAEGYAATSADFARSAFFFLFGDRVYRHVKSANG